MGHIGRSQEAKPNVTNRARGGIGDHCFPLPKLGCLICKKKNVKFFIILCLILERNFTDSIAAKRAFHLNMFIYFGY